MLPSSVRAHRLERRVISASRSSNRFPEFIFGKNCTSENARTTQHRRCELAFPPDLPTGRLCFILFLGPFQGGLMRGLMIGHASEFMIGRSFLPVIRSSVAGMRLSNKPSVEKAHVAPMVLA